MDIIVILYAILYIVANCYRLNMVEWQPSYVYTVVKTHACLLKGTNPLSLAQQVIGGEDQLTRRPAD